MWRGCHIWVRRWRPVYRRRRNMVRLVQVMRSSSPPGSRVYMAAAAVVAVVMVAVMASMPLILGEGPGLGSSPIFFTPTWLT